MNSATGRPDDAWRRDLWEDPGAVLDEVGLEPGTVLADVACGAGVFTLAAAARVAPGAVYAIDPDGTRLDEIDAGAVERGLDNVTTISGEASELTSLLPEEVDVVLVAEAFHAVPARTAFAEQVSRSLRPDGRLVIVEWRDRPPAETAHAGEPRGPPAGDRLDPDAVRSAVAPAEFTAVREIDLPPHHYALVCKRRHDA